MAEIRIDPLTGLRAIVGEDPAPAEDAAPVAAEANRDLFWAGPALGAHELIRHGEGNDARLAELGPEQLARAVEGWRERMRAHASAAYIHVGVDERGGETRAELYALDFVPAAIARERERFGAYATRTMGGNLLADLLQEEVRRRERVVAIDDECVLLSPYGARVAYQLMVVPRRPRARFEEPGPTGAAALHDAVGRLARRLGGPPPLSAWVRTAPQGAEHFCWRIDILPALRPPTGVELGTGLHVNAVTPETAAAELREA